MPFPVTLCDFLSQTPRGGAQLPAVRCGTETWTHQDLDHISTGLAKQIGYEYGLRPTVAVISDNHPYTLALMFAVWKLGGIFAPLDPNTPESLLRGMLTNIGATLVVLPSDASGILQMIKGMSLL